MSQAIDNLKAKIDALEATQAALFTEITTVVTDLKTAISASASSQDPEIQAQVDRLDALTASMATETTTLQGEDVPPAAV